MQFQVFIVLILLVQVCFCATSESSTEKHCKTKADCPSLYNCEQNICQHKPLFPITFRELFGVLYTEFLVGFAQAGGIGGGPIITTNLLVFINYNVKIAVAMTYIIVFGGAVGSYLKNSKETTSTGLPVINYNLALITLPLLVTGAILGVALNHLLPESVICITLIIVILQSVTKTMKKYKQLREDELKQQMKAQNAKSNELNIQLLTDKYQYVNPSLQIKYNEQKKKFPQMNICKTVGLLFLMLFLIFLKGGKVFASPLGIKPCSFAYWCWNILIFCITIIVLYFLVMQLKQEEELKESLGFDFKKYEKKFNDAQIATTIKASLKAGILGGLLGIGGGIILTPVWLELGFNARRVSATSTYTVLFTSFISLFQTIFTGVYRLQEVAFYGGLALISSYLVAGFLKWLMVKTNNQSLLILVLIIVMLFSLATMPIVSVVRMVSTPSSIYTFGQFC